MDGWEVLARKKALVRMWGSQRMPKSHFFATRWTSLPASRTGQIAPEGVAPLPADQGAWFHQARSE